VTHIYNFVAFTTPEANGFTKYEITKEKLSKGEPNAKLNFVFRTQDPIPDCSSVIIDFSKEYN